MVVAGGAAVCSPVHQGAGQGVCRVHHAKLKCDVVAAGRGVHCGEPFCDRDVSAGEFTSEFTSEFKLTLAGLHILVSELDRLVDTAEEILLEHFPVRQIQTKKPVIARWCLLDMLCLAHHHTAGAPSVCRDSHARLRPVPKDVVIECLAHWQRMLFSVNFEVIPAGGTLLFDSCKQTAVSSA